jgi:GT2 family glycosyltransferase
MAHTYSRYPEDEPGMANMLRIERECSGVTAACAAVRRDAWERVGGFCEELPGNFNDVDFSLKLRHVGLRILWTPHAVLYHFESLTRTHDVGASEVQFINRRWERVLFDDPYFNPNLDPGRTDWVVFKPPELWAG